MKKIRNDEKNTKEYFTKMFDERTTYGDTILHSALRHGPLEIVKAILMVAGSDPLYKNLVNLKNSSGKVRLKLRKLNARSKHNVHECNNLKHS